MKKIFLSGPIRGLPRSESLGWRDEAAKRLSASFVTAHALRGREEKETLPDPRLAIGRDKMDISESDIVLVNDTFPNASMIGTAMEVMHAHSCGKIVILFGDAHLQDYWLNYHSHARVQDLEAACDLLEKFLK